jgi:predicted nucleotidyltransferase
MLESTVLNAVRSYLVAVREAGIDARFGVVFGSQVTGRTHRWSDIDLLVVAPQFDDLRDRELVHRLWHIAARIDNRIEPIPCGLRQWAEDDSSAIIEVARRQGERLDAA